MISYQGFGLMTHELKKLAGGKLILALEGDDYDIFLRHMNDVIQWCNTMMQYCIIKGSNWIYSFKI